MSQQTPQSTAPKAAPAAPIQPVASEPKKLKGAPAAVFIPTLTSMLVLTLLAWDVGGAFSTAFVPTFTDVALPLDQTDTLAVVIGTAFPMCPQLLFGPSANFAVGVDCVQRSMQAYVLLCADDIDLLSSIYVFLCFFRSIAIAAWLTHFLEGLLCGLIAYCHSLPPLPWFFDALLVGAGATSALLAQLKIASPSAVVPAALAAFAVIATFVFRVMF